MVSYAASKCETGSSEAKKTNLPFIDDCSGIQPKPKIVIVGAGMAGLSAAVRLVNAGYDQITVLEATDRPGGRIYSCWMSNTVAEVGAEWISGDSLSNSVVPLASQAGLLETPLEYNYSKGVYLTSDGRALDHHLSHHAYLVFKQLVKQAYLLHNIKGAQSHGSLLNFFIVRIDQELNNFPEHQRKDAASVMYGLTNKVSNRWGTELENLSTDLLGSFVPLTGRTIGLPMGFAGALSPLIKQLPSGVVQYSKVVDKIQWKGVCDARCMVMTRDLHTYDADYVIVTVSLGVLKYFGDQLFAPNLPAKKKQAIDKIGFGNISKIFLEYAKPFWVPGQGPIKFAWTAQEIKEDTWLHGLHSLEEIPGCQHVLKATVSGCYANAVEDANDIELAKSVTSLLRQFTRDSTIPYPESVLRSKWKSSPYFCGSTSFMGIKSSEEFQNDLIAPIPPSISGSCKAVPKIFFAGEAMCKNFYSTVHGARVSGLKAAEEIITLTDQIGVPPVLE